MGLGYSVREEQLPDLIKGMILKGKVAGLKPTIGGKCKSRATCRLLKIRDQLTVVDRVLSQPGAAAGT